MLNVQQKQTMYIALAVILLLAFGWVIVWFYTLSSIQIHTNSIGNEIIVNQITNNSTNPVKVESKNASATVRVAAGTYAVTVTNGEQTKSQIVKVGIGETKKLEMSLGNSTIFTNPEPVTSLGAVSLAANKELVRFLDKNNPNGEIHNLNSTGTMTSLDSTVFYKQIKWSSSPDFGLGIGTEKSTNKLVIRKVDGNEVTTVITPFKPNQSTTIGVAPNKNWFVSDGKSVYQGFNDGSFKKLYSGDNILAIISASDNAILLSSYKEKSIREGSLLSLHTDGTKYQISGSVYEAAWSPDGKKILATGDTNGIYDDKLNKVNLTVNGNVAGLAWLDNDTVVYGLQNKLIKYTIKDGTTNTILSFPDSNYPYISYSTLSKDHDYLYVTIQKGTLRTSLKYKTYRIGLNGQPVPDLPLQSLDLLIPNTTYGCKFDFVNFNQFHILAHAINPGADCNYAANKYFATDYQIPLSSIALQIY